MLHYDLSEFRTPADERFGGYLTVRAWDDDGNEVSITTNKYGEGLFELIDRPDCYEYRQLKGTMQYKLPESESGVRAALRRRYEICEPYFHPEDFYIPEEYLSILEEF